MEQFYQDSIFRETQITQLEGSLTRMESNLGIDNNLQSKIQWQNRLWFCHTVVRCN